MCHLASVSTYQSVLRQGVEWRNISRRTAEGMYMRFIFGETLMCQRVCFKFLEDVFGQFRLLKPCIPCVTHFEILIVPAPSSLWYIHTNTYMIHGKRWVPKSYQVLEYNLYSQKQDVNKILCIFIYGKVKRSSYSISSTTTFTHPTNDNRDETTSSSPPPPHVLCSCPIFRSRCQHHHPPPPSPQRSAQVWVPLKFVSKWMTPPSLGILV